VYRIRFHGRGGQGIKTASRILGTAFFLEDFEVQDAPRYGAERRGAPIFAYVRAARDTIHERGIIRRPDLVIVADDSLIPVPGAAVLQGADAHTVLLVHSGEDAGTWRHRLNYPGPLLNLPARGKAEGQADLPYTGAACAGAAARVAGVISADRLSLAVEEELSHLGAEVVERNRRQALEAYGLLEGHQGVVEEGVSRAADGYERPEWIDLPFEDARLSAPAIHAAATSVEVRTGLWRTVRPVVDYERCNRCWWLCSSFCPDGAIHVRDDSRPEIDYQHCKGCLVCVAQCPPHAIEVVPEAAFRKQEQPG
jgi:pyruvate ferredoxin oxidoreductase gamma subunit